MEEITRLTAVIGPIVYIDLVWHSLNQALQTENRSHSISESLVHYSRSQVQLQVQVQCEDTSPPCTILKHHQLYNPPVYAWLPLFQSLHQYSLMRH